MSKKVEDIMCKLVGFLDQRSFQQFLDTLEPDELQPFFEIMEEYKARRIDKIIDKQPIYFEAEEVISYIKSKLDK